MRDTFRAVLAARLVHLFIYKFTYVPSTMHHCERTLIRTVVLLLTISCQFVYAQWDLSKMVTGTEQNRRFHFREIPADLLTDWPRDMEDEFQRRANVVIAAQTKNQKAGVNTYFENEKRTYGYLMAHILGGNAETALKYLQAQDHQHQEWHRETEGIDYFACFTLKHQMRKYFYFGDLLDADYKRQMFNGAKKWTSKDPFRRPHYAYKGPKEGWGPDAKNSWVDVRSTENLWLMRTTAVYLMAEETGNKQTTAKYREHLLNYARTLYRVGIGEWDSENYHGHSIAPLLNLFDFARDRQIKAAAKACLDFFAAAGAVKYWRGGFNGPTKRDYNHAQPFGGSAASGLWMWFGDHPTGKIDHWESDEIHQITSAYRPPLAVVELAHKRFQRPVEIFAAKPAYDATTQFRYDSKPEYAETQYIAHSYQMGSLTGGTSVDGGDVNGFKILAWDEDQGAVALHAIPGSDPAYPGSPMYKTDIVSAENRVAQQENIAIWLIKNGQAPWLWVIPENVRVTNQKGITFLQCDRTWVGITPLGTTEISLDEGMSNELSNNTKSKFPGHKVLSAKGISSRFCGLAIEVGEKESHDSFADFQSAVLAAVIDRTQLGEGIVRYKSNDGKWLGIHWSDDPLNLGVWRNGKRRDLTAVDLYDSRVIKAPWGAGHLEVATQSARFRCTVDEQGNVTFQQN